MPEENKRAQPNQGNGAAVNVSDPGNVVTSPWLWGFLTLTVAALGLIIFFNTTTAPSDDEVRARILESLRAPAEEGAQGEVSEQERSQILESLRAPEEATSESETETGGGPDSETVTEQERSQILESLRAPAE